MTGGENGRSIFTYETLVHAISGAAGSVVAMATFFPLDTVRSRLQLEEGRQAKNTLTTIRELVSKEGSYTLYRGIVPVLESLCASNFVYFYTFHGLKLLRSSRNQTAGNDLLVASIAGIINVLTTTPLWVVNTRLKMKGINGLAERSNNDYDNLIEGLFHIWKYEGLKNLWAGTLPSLMLVANPAIQFMTYESIKRRVNTSLSGAQPPAWIFFTIGAIAKTIATTLTYPLQLVQTKLRHGHNYLNLSPNAGTVQILMYILKKQGLPGLYKGMEAKLLQTVLTAALMFLAYEKISSFVFRLLLHRPILRAALSYGENRKCDRRCRSETRLSARQHPHENCVSVEKLGRLRRTSKIIVNFWSKLKIRSKETISEPLLLVDKKVVQPHRDGETTMNTRLARGGFRKTPRNLVAKVEKTKTKSNDELESISYDYDAALSQPDLTSFFKKEDKKISIDDDDKTVVQNDNKEDHQEDHLQIEKPADFRIKLDQDPEIFKDCQATEKTVIQNTESVQSLCPKSEPIMEKKTSNKKLGTVKCPKSSRIPRAKCTVFSRLPLKSRAKKSFTRLIVPAKLKSASSGEVQQVVSTAAKIKQLQQEKVKDGKLSAQSISVVASVASKSRSLAENSKSQVYLHFTTNESDTTELTTDSTIYETKKKQKKRQISSEPSSSVLPFAKSRDVPSPAPKMRTRPRLRFSFFNTLFDIIFWPFLFLRTDR